MMKEKVNTHFSFPLRLDMTPYTEDFLMGKSDRKEGNAKFLSLAYVYCKSPWQYSPNYNIVIKYTFKKIKLNLRKMFLKTIWYIQTVGQ